MEDAFSRVILESLISSPLLVENLPEAACFSREGFCLPSKFTPLNLQQKLGHLYEDALAILLETSPRCDLLARSIQLQKDRHTTLGELDFLVRDTMEDRLIHIELATKFYLAVEGAEGLLLPGPDARDNYFRKLQRLRDHQLVLVEKYGQFLPEAFQKLEVKTEQLVYGCLFDHVRAEALARPEFVRSDCRRGRWLHLDELGRYFSKEARFEKVPKALWPVPFELLSDVKLELWQMPKEVDHCIMLRINEERVPYFVAPSGYPG